jgi:hypothetical protein
VLHARVVFSNLVARRSSLALLLVVAAALAGCQRPSPVGDLGRAAASGDITRLKVLLGRTSADTPEDALSALAWAARSGQVEAATALLDAGADPNRRDRRNGWTPLMHAIHTSHGAVARLLLARGADARLGAGDTSPALMAVLDDDAALVRTMLAAGLQRDQRQHALDEAIGGGALADLDRPIFGTCRTATAREILQHDPTLAIDRSGSMFSPLWWARRQGCDATVALVIGRSTVARR